MIAGYGHNRRTAAEPRGVSRDVNHMRKGTNPVVNSAAVLLLAGAMMFHAQTVAAQVTIDNSSLSSSEFRKHERTFGLVYTLPSAVNGG